MRLGATLTNVARTSQVKQVTFSRDTGEDTVEADEIVVAVGRAPNVDDLDLAVARVAFGRQGVQVDDRLRTTNRRIYAAGDVCSQYKFTHAADAMARIVIQNALFFGRKKASALVIPWLGNPDSRPAGPQQVRLRVPRWNQCSVFAATGPPGRECPMRLASAGDDAMSANANLTTPDTKRILLIAANPSTSQTTGWPIGFWWSELTHAYWAFTETGYDTEIRSPDGGALQADGYSDPEDPSGYSAHDILSLGFKKSPGHIALIQDTKSLDDLNVEHYDAVFVIGGQSPMFTFRGNTKLQHVIRTFYEAGRATALVCHATCVLLEATLTNGELLVKGKTWTGFANSEETLADSVVGTRIQPFWIEDEARKMEGTNFIVDQPFRAFAVRDGLLVTGQQQFSSAAAARLVIEVLGR